jgi:hypothetical protein
VDSDLESLACTPFSVSRENFNAAAQLPYECTIDHIHFAMQDFVEFLGFVNLHLHTKQIAGLEAMLMPANFSSIVGEFLAVVLPKYCSTLVKNQYHNGHPDLIPTNLFPNNAAQHTSEGIEIKASRYLSGWQGHNPEDVWLLIFVFDSNRPNDALKNVQPKPFRFLQVVGAGLTKEDWIFSGRSETSRRTITASVGQSGYRKMMSNWIYRAPVL